MNVTFLGDALDFWKGCLFSRLRAEQLLRNLVVEPLLTDFQDWHPNEFALLIGVTADRTMPAGGRGRTATGPP